MFDELTTMCFEVDDAAIGRLVLSAPERRNPHAVIAEPAVSRTDHDDKDDQ